MAVRHAKSPTTPDHEWPQVTFIFNATHASAEGQIVLKHI